MHIRIVTYSTVPRGDVVHAHSLAAALAQRGHEIELWSLAPPDAPALRSLPVATHLVPLPAIGDETDEQLAFRGASLLAEAMEARPTPDISHAEDAIAAHALLRLRDRTRLGAVVRTIHHVDAFTNPGLLEWQRQSIVDADLRLCVSQHWADRVSEEFGVGASVVANGTDAARFAGCALTRDEGGARFGWGSRPVVLAVGGIEPRKGSRLLLESFARARGRLGDGALLVVAGGGGMFGAPDYREAWRQDAERLRVRVYEGPPGAIGADVDVAVIGVVAEDQMPALYRAADVLAFPSTREGFGLVVLEAIASGIPAVVSDIPVLREHLTHGHDCLMVPIGDSAPLADALVSAMRDGALRERLQAGGTETLGRFSWATCAAEHELVYGRLLRTA